MAEFYELSNEEKSILEVLTRSANRIQAIVNDVEYAADFKRRLICEELNHISIMNKEFIENVSRLPQSDYILGK